MRYQHTVTSISVLLAFCVACLPVARGQSGSASGNAVAKWAPAQKPTMVGPIDVGIVLVLFPDTELKGGIPRFKSELDNINGITQEQYFKIYSNDITWPVPTIYPNENASAIYRAPECYGYYCKFNTWSDPIGWHSTEEGQKRAALLKADTMKEARNRSPSAHFKSMAFCYITTPISDPAVRPDLRRYYAANCGRKPEQYPDPLAKTSAGRPDHGKDDLPPLYMGEQPFDPWGYYRPSVNWGEPMWPNSSIQFNNASAGTFAHEFGHVLGAPDVYRIGRANDGIGGTAVLLNYGPTATAFSRFYHHGFIQEKNYPTITTSGTFTLYPRHIKPEQNEALGYIIPSCHPHYFYQIEYVYGENPALCAGGNDESQNHRKGEFLPDTSNVEGVLISVINLNTSNYLGSPDGFYTYRPGDPYFLGKGDLNNCLFGSLSNRQEFNMTTDPSSRLPNLLDGGVIFKNITEHQGTATFDVEIDKSRLSPSAYQTSLLPQVKLEPIDQILPTSFRMTVTPIFRGEPLMDQYGMCWSVTPKPDINHDHFSLGNCNYNMYRGRALSLRPNTKYYIRGWATNARGIRYSDEELVVKTPPSATKVEMVEPLLMDSFSDNGMLHEQFSNQSFDHYGQKTKSYESYAPVAVLAKLAAYYHPDNLLAPHANVAPNRSRPAATLGPGRELIAPVNPRAGTTKSPVDFGRLHWDPFATDPAWRTVETLALFEEMRNQSRGLKMHDLGLGREFVTGFARLFKFKLTPQFQLVTSKNIDTAVKLIKNELVNARPVMVIESPQAHEIIGSRIQWGLIDGFRDDDTLHIDFPLDTEFLKGKNDRLKYTTLGELLEKNYDLAIVTQIDF